MVRKLGLLAASNGMAYSYILSSPHLSSLKVQQIQLFSLLLPTQNPKDPELAAKESSRDVSCKQIQLPDSFFSK